MEAQLGPCAAVAFSSFLAWSWFPLPWSGRTAEAATAGRIVPTGNTVKPRFDHTATLLPSGKVLIAVGMARNGIAEPVLF
jgi:hypothetical protein